MLEKNDLFDVKEISLKGAGIPDIKESGYPDFIRSRKRIIKKGRSRG